MASPVKYMVLGSTFFQIVDTSADGGGDVIAECFNSEDAEKVCYALNTIEGYVYIKKEDRNGIQV